MAQEQRATPPVGVLVMAYGTPASYDEVEAFYTDVRRGRPPSPEQLADLKRRYAAVGGVSQLSARTAEQVAGIQTALDRQDPARFSCRYGAKHASPSIEETMEQMRADGIEELVGLVLAPHYSVRQRRRVPEKGEDEGGRARHADVAHRGLARSSRPRGAARRTGRPSLCPRRCRAGRRRDGASRDRPQPAPSDNRGR